MCWVSFLRAGELCAWALLQRSPRQLVETTRFFVCRGLGPALSYIWEMIRPIVRMGLIQAFLHKSIQMLRPRPSSVLYMGSDSSDCARGRYPVIFAQVHSNAPPGPALSYIREMIRPILRVIFIKSSLHKSNQVLRSRTAVGQIGSGTRWARDWNEIRTRLERDWNQFCTRFQAKRQKPIKTRFSANFQRFSYKSRSNLVPISYQSRSNLVLISFRSCLDLVQGKTIMDIRINAERRFRAYAQNLYGHVASTRGRLFM